MSRAIQIYHRLPAFARFAAASLRGFQLRQWRYGPETELLVREALERETWDAGRWQEWQQSSLARMLKHASEDVPYYREAWQRRQTTGEMRSPLLLQNWPVLSKETLRLNPKSFIAEGVSTNRLRVEHTSGTTGTPLQLWQSRATARKWYALMEARWRGWNGLSRTDRWAILGGQLVAPISQKKPPFWVWNVGLKQLYLSTSHLSERTCVAYLNAIKDYRVVYLWGYASALYSLALFAD
jgi:phenylacetate-CoA ligase